MSSGEISLNGENYTIVDRSRVKASQRVFTESTETEQPVEGAGGRPVTKSWKLSGPLGNSRQKQFGDPLGIDYTDNLDHEFDGLLTSAAKRNAVTLTDITGSSFGVPISDALKTNWAQGAGDGDGDAFDELDEGIISGTPDDATTYWTTSTAAAWLQVGITSMTDPGTDEGFVIRMRVRCTTTAQINLKLRDNSIGYTTGSGFSVSAVDTWETIAFTIPAIGVDDIVDFTDLEMMVQLHTGATGTLDVTALELELPAAGFGNVITIDSQFGFGFANRGRYATMFDPADMTEIENNNRTSVITDTAAEWQGEGILAYGAAKDLDKRTAATDSGATYGTIAGTDATKLAVALDRLWLAEAGKNDAAEKGKLKYTEESAALTALSLSNGFYATDPNATITGLFWTGVHAIVGHSRGVNSFTDAGKQASLLNAVQDLPAVANGARADSTWGWSYVATVLGLYAIHTSALIANPVGPGEGIRGKAFEGPIDGYPTAIRFFKESLYVAYLNPDGTTYVFKGTFGPETGGTGRPEWYGFRKYSATEVHAFGATQRTNPTLIVGENDNLSWYTLSTRGREIADANYQFGTDGGEAFGTTLMLPVGLVGNLRWAKFLAENTAASTDTWQLAVSPDEGAYVNVGSAVATDGLATVRPVTSGVPDGTSSFSTLKPKLTQVASSESAPTQIRGDLTMSYDERAEMVRGISVLVEARDGALDRLQALADVSQKTPVPWGNPNDTTVNPNATDGTSRYAYVTHAVMEDLKDPSDQGIRLTILEWATS